MSWTELTSISKRIEPNENQVDYDETMIFAHNNHSHSIVIGNIYQIVVRLLKMCHCATYFLQTDISYRILFIVG